MAFDDPNDYTVIDYRGIEIYQSDIDILTQEYIQSLPDESMIYKSAVFSGLLQVVYKRVLKNVIPKWENIDFKLLDTIFYNVYIPLCYRYNIVPSVLQFTSMCRINYGNIEDVKHGLYSSNGSKASKASTEIVKRWHEFIESGLLSKTANESSIGSMFILKSVYQYKEANTLTIEHSAQEQHDSAEAIAERHKDAMLPDKPNV